MYTVTRMVEATPEQIWGVLEDGWSYPSWVVGASRMRAVGDDWPAKGSKLHHSAGIWPAVVNDDTTVLESEPPRLLRLQAKGWPAGEATVELRIEPAGNGSKVTIVEDATRGPGHYIPMAMRQPLIALRNTETLRRLAYMAEGRTDPRSSGGHTAGSTGSLHKSKIHRDGEN
jgi:Polyketide cyclase / dehydrase and lipid transport